MNSFRQNLSSIWGSCQSESQPVVGPEPSQSNSIADHVQSRRYWMSDAVSIDCHDCGAKFNVIRRKHHCRICGQIFCHKCCSIFIPGQMVNCSGTLRVCSQCNKSILQHTSNANESQAALPLGENHHQPQSIRKVSLADPFLGIENENFGNTNYPEETAATLSPTLENFLLSDPQKMELLLEQMEAPVGGVELGTKFYNKKMYYQCFTGEELVDWIRKRDEGITDVELAKTICQGLLSGGLILSLCQQTLFQDDASPYRLANATERKNKNLRKISNRRADDISDPEWLKKIEVPGTRPHQDEVDMGEEVMEKPEKQNYEIPKFNSRAQSESELSSTDNYNWSKFDECYASFVSSVLSYLLDQANLDQVTWHPIVLGLVRNAVAKVKPNYRGKNDMFDLREYVKIKKVPGGDCGECQQTTGEVFSGRILVKGMPLEIKKAKVLLIRGSLSFHRADKYVGLMTVARQEEEYLKNICDRIIKAGPDLLFIEQSVSGIALDILEKHGIAVITCVKNAVLERIARFLDMEVISCIQSLFTEMTMGIAEMYKNEIFHLGKVKTKSLVFVEGSKPKLGCTILLRGGRKSDLVKLKEIIHRLLLFESNAKYEKHFFMSEHAKGPDMPLNPVGNMNHVTLSPFITVHSKITSPSSSTAEVISEISKQSPTLVPTADKIGIKEGLEQSVVEEFSKNMPVEALDLIINGSMDHTEIADTMASYRANILEIADHTRAQESPQGESDEDVDVDYSYAFHNGLDMKHFPVLFSSFAPSTKAAPFHCVPPWIISMEFYGEKDLPLGSFLETFCFSSSFECSNKRNCSSDMTKHVRRFCHNQSFLKLTVQRLEEPIFPMSNNENTTMWKHCKICKISTPPRTMNYEMYMYSFTMFLMAHFYDKSLVRRGRLAKECQHSLHRDHVTCFSRGSETAVFECYDLMPLDVVMRSGSIFVPDLHVDLNALEDENKILNCHGSELFSCILNEILKFKSEDPLNEKSEEKLQQSRKDQETDYDFFKELQQSVQTYIVAQDLLKAYELIFKSKIFLGDCVTKWRINLSRLHEDLKHEKIRTNSGEAADKMFANISKYDTIVVNPFPPNLHFNIVNNQKIVVDENQPSSIIAHILSTAEYEDFLESTSDHSKIHYECQFQDDSCKFYCCIYFAQAFQNLRNSVIQSEKKAESFINSISTCSPWETSGGKSGMVFYKTKDDRFILKQMSRFEYQSFQTFAPHYFKYILDAHSKDRPTCLAKILGVFRIGFKNSSTTNKSFKMDLLIIENVFYNRNITQKYDLKGSNRNRLAETSGKNANSSLVLLDENLLKDACENPLYISQESENRLLKAIQFDSQFLSSHSMMDYSLLVGKDCESSELILGIIDYIRTFTWDKKLETLVKSSGLLGGGGKTPTVISPNFYMGRFRDAMHKYFKVVPDIDYQDPTPLMTSEALNQMNIPPNHKIKL